MSKHENNNLELPGNLALNEKDAILEFSNLLRKKFGTNIREFFLFGSKVKNYSERYSDIDILIVLNRLSWEIKKSISELASEENIKYNVLISTIRYDFESWNDPNIKASPFAQSVRNEGIRL